MSQRSVISDPFKFAAEQRSLSNDTPVARFSRLADLLADDGGTVSWRVSGSAGPQGEPMLEIAISGELHLCCQRCLGALPWQVDIASKLKLVRPGTEIPDDELEIEEYDTIEAAADMDALALIEDELLLAVPVAPRHEVCDAPHPSGGVEKESPFNALSQLQKRDET